jgi:hypothetical protein
VSTGQLSFFSADALPAAPEHLEGLLCGPGQVVRQNGEARVSTPVRDEQRVGPLLDALEALSLPGEVTQAEGGTTVVRTAFTPVLLPLAKRWSGGGAKRAPADLVLDGPRLRWWALAQGRVDEAGYVLGLGPQDDDVWAPVGAALARAGVPAALLGPRADGPAYRISGQRRLERLRELVGVRPTDLSVSAWPGP